MFGCLVAGRLLQTNLVQIDETQGMFTIPNPESINHLCVFLLGTAPFPDGYGATVHFHMPGKGFQILGMISNEKPSAIFRVRNAGYSTQNTSNILAMTPTDASNEAIVGLSIEPLESVFAQVAALPTSAGPDSLVTTRTNFRPTLDPSNLAQKVAQNLFNFLSSFEPVGDGVFVRLVDLERWYEKFTQKIKNQGLGFLNDT